MTNDEDAPLRKKVQEVNERIAKALGLSNSTLHYFLWNLFRNCCGRGHAKCEDCGLASMPTPYGGLFIDKKACLFCGLCDAFLKDVKPDEPPYIGHFY